jgi:hypothetical protein
MCTVLFDIKSCSAIGDMQTRLSVQVGRCGIHCSLNKQPQAVYEIELCCNRGMKRSCNHTSSFAYTMTTSVRRHQRIMTVTSASMQISALHVP